MGTSPPQAAPKVRISKLPILPPKVLIMNHTICRSAVCVLAVIVFWVDRADAQPLSSGGVVPGTGTWIDYVGDDFEDTSWSFVNRFPKSSRENNERLNSPTGYSTNHRWIEGPERGQPDHMAIVPTPEGGLEGSKHAMLMRTLNSGVPGGRSFDVQQDDVVANCISRLGSTIPVSETPSCVVRLYLPPADEWENRSGPHFGFRVSASTIATERTSSGFFGSRSTTKAEPYWPGMWIHFRSKTSRRVEKDSAYITVRGNRMGRDFKVLDIEEEKFGWWTLGMSITANGMVHYYAHPGVEDLTAADHITSQYPYGFSAQRFRTFFFDVCNKNDGKSWSTPFVIDDARLYLVNASRVQKMVQRKIERAAQQAAARKNKKSTAKRKRTRTR